MTVSLSEIGYQAPFLALATGGILLFVLEAFTQKASSRRWLMWLALATVGVAGGGCLMVLRHLGDHTGYGLMHDMLIADRYSAVVTLLFLVGAALTLLMSADYLREHDTEYGEYYGLVLLATAGMAMLVMAGDFVTVFLGIETMSLAVYVLTGSFRRSRRSSEAAMKYFLTGAFATGFLLYGIALVYGMSGTTNLAEIGAKGQALAGKPLFLIGEMLLLVAFGFKIAVVPFHMWAPDAYEGAPTPVTAFMAAGVKAAGITALLRVFLTAFGGNLLPFGRTGWASILGVLAALTMTLGNLAALRQENLKRMLAYSSISHAGYLLIGVVAAGIGQSKLALPAVLFYLAAYTFTTVGAFGVLAWLGRRGDERALLDDWSGLATRHPGAALAMTIFLLSLGGMPPTAGFFGKFYVFRAAMQAWDDQLVWLVVVAVSNSVISAYYYLRPVVAMYFREPTRPMQPLATGPITFVLVASSLLVLEMGLLPSPWLDFMSRAAMR